MGKIRPSPGISASTVAIGTKMKGGDGNIWVCARSWKEAKNLDGKKRWYKKTSASAWRAQAFTPGENGEWVSAMPEAPNFKAAPAAMKAAPAAMKAASAAMKAAPAAMKSGGGKLAGKTLCFTGALSVKRSTATAAAKAAGAIVTSGVSAKTNILVVGAGAGSKLAKGGGSMQCWTEKKFLRTVGM